MKSKTTNSLYEKVYYDANIASVKTITGKEVMSLNKQSVDHFLAVDLGIWAFRNSKGEWIEKRLSKESLGTTCLKILECVQCEPGVFYMPGEIAELTKIHSLRNPNNLSARWRALRLSHQETFKNPNFFLSKRTGGMGVAWNPEKTFMQIIRIGTSQSEKTLKQ